MLLPARAGAAAQARKNRGPWRLRTDAETQLLIGLTVIAAVLRFATIARQSYWLDESQAVHELRLSFGAMLGAWNSAEWNPPLYLLVAWPWAKLFGTGELELRALSGLLGVALVPLMYLCGRELVSRRAGLAAAALAAVNPFMIWYSQEAREYMLLMALCAGSLVFFARAWRCAGRRDLLWWAVLSSLALLTQYFAGFLVAAEGLALVYRTRSRASVMALGALGLVELALIPHVIPRLREPAFFIVSVPLSLRLQQVPVAFGLNTLYHGSIAAYGLIGMAALAAIVIALLVVGADGRELRGAGVAAGLAAAVLLIPLALALLGHDDYIARGLMPAWLALAVVIGAACAGRRARGGGAALLFVLLASFIYAGIQIDSHARYQRPDWRGVAAALAAPAGTRVIVAYDGQFAAGPLSVYLPGVAWAGPGAAPISEAPVTAGELDIVGDNGQRVAAKLPPGARLFSARRVNGYLVDRFALASPWRLTPAQFGARATAMLGPAARGPSVLIQHRSQ